MMKARLIVPAYNEEENVGIFYQEAIKYLSYEDIDFDILFVNDGSRDHTLEAVKNIEAKDIPIKYISLSRNFGKESAMHAGLVNSQDKDFIIIVDCDLQQPPALIPEMIEYYREGYKIIYTKSKTRDGEPRLRRLFANMFYKIYNIYTERPLINGAKDYQLMDKQVVDAFIKIKDNNRFVKGIFSWVGFKRKCIEFEFIPRKHGKTSWSFYSLLKYAFNGMNQFSTILLVLPVLSLILSLLVFITDTFLFLNNMISLSTFILTLHLGLIMLALSIFSYIIIYLLYQNRKQVLQRPVYLIEEASEDLQVE
ncbi:glycosyltransferase family 2 protein [Mycoplasmatota bacterium]|nr:glycosyltransferase family 2 protein [Mycoplasmatota bacterium]